MALISCPECGKEISDLSDVCIGCGFPIKKHIDEQDERKSEFEKKKAESERIKEQYWCRSCYKQNEVGEDYCVYCGNRLTPYYKREQLEINKEEAQSNSQPEEKFQGIYRFSFGKKQEVYCPKCGSEDCSYSHDQKVIPGKTKTRYSANLNPLHPFTFVNKKEKIVRKEKIVTESIIVCNSCGNIFK